VNAGLCELVCQKPHSIALREPEQMLGFPVASPLCQKVVFSAQSTHLQCVLASGLPDWEISMRDHRIPLSEGG
jgi:hypothetical protein